MQIQSQKCTAAPATQNGSGETQRQPHTEPFGLRAAWLRFTTEVELRRLAKLHMRIERRKRGLDDLIIERQLIMNRCIRRMRRHNGKN